MTDLNSLTSQLYKNYSTNENKNHLQEWTAYAREQMKGIHEEN